MPRQPLLAAIIAAAALSSLAPCPACAATASASMRPGLWEITSKIQPGNSQAAAAMAEAQKQMANMPPEQRKMLESMMAKQGVGLSMNGDGVKVTYCVTKEMAERHEFPTGQQGKCTNSSTPTANGMNVSFSCSNPPSSGTGQVTFQGDTGYTTSMHVTTSARGKPETMNVDGTGRWLGADCGTNAPQ